MGEAEGAAEEDFLGPDSGLVHRPISSLWNRLAFVGLDGGEAFWGEGPDSPWWSR